MLRGDVNVFGALGEWWQHRRTAKAVPLPARPVATGTVAAPMTENATDPLAAALLGNASTSNVPVLWALSGNDRTAAEFRALVAGDAQWQAVLGKPTATRLELPEADHTLSAAADHDHLAAAVVEWLTRVA